MFKPTWLGGFPHRSGRQVSCRSCPRAARTRCSQPAARRRTAIQLSWPYRRAAWWETTEEQQTHLNKLHQTNMMNLSSWLRSVKIHMKCGSQTSVTIESLSPAKVMCWWRSCWWRSCWEDGRPSCCSILYSGVAPTRTISMDWQAIYTWWIVLLLVCNKIILH